jgi:hypothetical protein
MRGEQSNHWRIPMAKTVEVIVRRPGSALAPTMHPVRVIKIETVGSDTPKSVNDAPYPPHTGPTVLVRVSGISRSAGHGQRRTMRERQHVASHRR